MDISSMIFDEQVKSTIEEWRVNGIARRLHTGNRRLKGTIDIYLFSNPKIE